MGLRGYFPRFSSIEQNFQLSGVTPDIVTLGKPIGNGFPLSAVVTRREIADAYWKSGSQVNMELFLEFSFNYSSTSIHLAVMQYHALQLMQC